MAVVALSPTRVRELVTAKGTNEGRRAPTLRGGGPPRDEIDDDLFGYESEEEPEHDGSGGQACARSTTDTEWAAALPEESPLRPTMTAKVLVLGDTRCGKTSIIKRWVRDTFSAAYGTTLGADYFKKDIIVRSRCIRFQIWDIAGQDRFKKITRGVYKRALGAIVVCDVTREGTFDSVAEWKSELDAWRLMEQDRGLSSQSFVVHLVANKIDLLEGDAQDSALLGARLQRMAQEHGFSGWHIVSAKNSFNLAAAMEIILSDVILSQAPSSSAREQSGDSFKLTPHASFGERKGCCV